MRCYTLRRRCGESARTARRGRLLPSQALPLLPLPTARLLVAVHSRCGPSPPVGAGRSDERPRPRCPRPGLRRPSHQGEPAAVRPRVGERSEAAGSCSSARSASIASRLAGSYAGPACTCASDRWPMRLAISSGWRPFLYHCAMRRTVTPLETTWIPSGIASHVRHGSCRADPDGVGRSRDISMTPAHSIGRNAPGEAPESMRDMFSIPSLRSSVRQTKRPGFRGECPFPHLRSDYLPRRRASMESSTS